MFRPTRVFELRKEIELILRHRGSGIAEHFENDELGLPDHLKFIRTLCRFVVIEISLHAY